MTSFITSAFVEIIDGGVRGSLITIVSLDLVTVF